MSLRKKSVHQLADDIMVTTGDKPREMIVFEFLPALRAVQLKYVIVKFYGRNVGFNRFLSAFGMTEKIE